MSEQEQKSVTTAAVPGFWQSVLLTLGFWGLALCGGVVLGVCIGLLRALDLGFDPAAQPVVMTFFGGMLNLIAFGLVLTVGVMWARRPLQALFPFRRFNLWLLVPLLVLAVGCSILLSEVDNLVQYVLPAPEFLKAMMARMVGSGWASFFVLVIVAPVTEELFFRGLILDGFQRRYSKRRAIVLSAVLFAVFHLNPYQFAGAFVLGLVMAWLRLESKSLWPCLFVHACNNGLVFFVVAAGIEIPGYSSRGPNGQFQGPLLDSLGMAFAVFGGLGAWWLLKRRTGDTDKVSHEAG